MVAGHCPGFLRADKAARYGIQSITFVSIAGGVLEYGTASASWDMSARLPKGNPYVGSFHRQFVFKSTHSIVYLHSKYGRTLMFENFLQR